jgi:hypothetical protein
MYAMTLKENFEYIRVKPHSGKACETAGGTFVLPRLQHQELSSFDDMFIIDN